MIRFFIFGLLFASCQSELSNAIDPECLQNRNGRASLTFRMYSNFDGADGSEIEFLAAAADKLLHPSHMRSEACQTQILDRFTESISKVDRKITSLEQDDRMRASLRDLRDATDGIHFVYEAIKLYRLHKGHETRENVKEKCKSNYPGDVLTKICRRVESAPNIFDELVVGSKYSQQIFNNLSAIITTESAMCSVLAQTCDRLRYGKRKKLLFVTLKKMLDDKLKKIFERLVAAKRNLKSNYEAQAKLDIENELERIAENNIDVGQAVTEIFNLLKQKYPFRAWLVMMYDRVHWNANKVHAFNGTNAIFAANSHHTVVAHSADKEQGCSEMKKIFSQKSLQQLYVGAEEKYSSLLTTTGDLRSALSLLRQQLQQYRLFDNHFLAVLRYRPDMVIMSESDYHYHENLVDPNTGRFMKTVVIGWC